MYRGVLLRPLCTTHPERSGAKPRLSYVFYSLFDCETRLKLVHVGFHPAAKSALEQERVAKEEERRQQQQLCGRHRAAVLSVLQRLPKLRQHLLSHFKRYLRDCYTPSSASQAAADVGRYLAGRSIYLEKADGRSEISRRTVSVASRILIAQLRSQVQGMEAETSIRQSGAYGPELRSLAEQLELSLMVEAYEEIWETSERPWPGVFESEKDVIFHFDAFLVDMAALRGFCQTHYDAGSSASTLATLCRHLIKAIEWRRGLHQSLSNGVTNSTGLRLTIAGIVASQFDEAIVMLSGMAKHYTRNMYTLNENRNIPSKARRSVIADMSVYDALSMSLEQDILAFEATASAWSSGLQSLKVSAFRDLVFGVVSFLQCGFVPSRPLPLSSITFVQWTTARDSALTRYDALRIGESRGGGALTDDTILSAMCANEKKSAQRNGKHQFFITRRLLRVMRVYELARTAVRTSMRPESPFFVDGKGTKLTSGTLSQAIVVTSAWYTGHKINITDLRSSHAAALTGAGTASFRRTVETINESEGSVQPSNLGPSRKPEMAVCTPPAPTCSTASGLDHSIPEPGSAASEAASASCNPQSPSLLRPQSVPLCNVPTPQPFAQYDDRIGVALEKMSSSPYAHTGATRDGRPSELEFFLAGGDIGHGAKSHIGNYVPKGPALEYQVSSMMLAKAAGRRLPQGAGVDSSVDSQGRELTIAGADLRRYNAMKLGQATRSMLASRGVESYVTPCAEP